MAFRPTRYSEGDITKVRMSASVTVAKYDALVVTSGFVLRATSSATECRYVAMEAKVDDGTNEYLKVVRTMGVEFIADTNADPVVATDLGIYADLTDHDTLNESASSNNVFFVEDTVGALTDKQVRGFFVMKTS